MMPRIHVLMIEDSDDDAVLVIERLRRGGFEVISDRVEDSEAAASVLRTRPPDLVICDYHMPAFGAEAALMQLRASGLDIPFIVVSGQVGEETAAALMRAGAHDFLLKDRMSRLVPAVQRELREADDRQRRRQAEAALRRSEERFRLLAEQATDVLFRCRLCPRAEVEYVSPAIRMITGYPPEDLCGRPDTLFSLVDKEDRPTLKGSWRTANPEPLRVRWHPREGVEVWTEQRVVGVHDDQGHLVAVQGILRDVTEQVHADEERERLRRQLDQTERLESLGRLAGGVAHDFNNLLGVITGYAEIVLDTLPDDDPCRADMDEISRAADQAAGLTRQLLTFSRQESSKPETLDLNAVVEGTRNLLRRTIGEDIEIVTLLDPDLHPVTIDPSKIQQVVMNLVVNSRAAMPDGGRLTLSTANLDRDRGPSPADRPAAHGRPSPEERPKRGWACLAVADTGCGMSPEVIRRAVEPFFTTKGPGEGTGLGLATVYGVVKAAGGEVDIESEVGKGTTIRILLPATARSGPAPVDTTRDDTTRDDTTRDDATRGQGKTILVVEDDAAVRAVTTRILVRSGYLVHEAGSPAEALDRFGPGTTRIDALLTDAIMPGMTGYQLIEQFRRTRPELPVMLMSGYAAGAEKSVAGFPPGVAHLQKPFTARALLDSLERTLHPR
ncbi:hybrid sensor histidine kinase/response regulator [Frankia sp. B2]|nr:hybrid sensor histidine kinase/response regulator [Frankia sp. B2]KDA40632.1 PAS/PAC sensor hybrid histidine kinase [Frankia sp. BMG5.23]